MRKPSSESLEYWRLFLTTVLLALAFPVIVYMLVTDPMSAIRHSSHL